VDERGRFASILSSSLLSIALLLSSPGSATAREAIDVEKYQGVWYEVASLKRGFAGEGQLDCHCTQGLYSKTDQGKMSVKTFCVHGSSTGKISGIEGRVSCESAAGDAEGEGFQGCRLNFPSIPFIPPEPYNVLDTDYTSFALVEGAKGKSLVTPIGELEKLTPLSVRQTQALSKSTRENLNLARRSSAE